MADAKITALTANTTPVSTDLTVMVDDPSGTPLTQKITFDNLHKLIISLGLGKIIATSQGFNKL